MDKFTLFHKWFWVGLLVATIGGFSGIIFGLALLAEPEHRKEGWILTIWSLIVMGALSVWIVRGA
ncbi:hypothetical protein KGO95_02315 [Patescibacteria group bacterium]|nr:hypothetical protein [Patescibacteria group bacterium]